MKDRWMNIGYEERELKPFKDKSKQIDEKKIGNNRTFVYTKIKILFRCKLFLFLQYDDDYENV